MLPLQVLSNVPVKGAYLAPDNYTPALLVDYDMGGIGLHDPSQGLQVQVWTLEYLGGIVFISAPNTPRTVLFSLPNITELSLAFDQNMNPFVAFMQSNPTPQARFWWYDTVTQTQIFTDLPSGSTSPRCCLDDKRPSQSALCDIILAYMRAGSLYFRAQRDRYLVEYLLASSLNARLDRIGMTKQNRVQFRLIPNV